MKTIRTSGDSSQELLVQHPNGELRWLPIEAWSERWICVRWGLAGQYDVMLKDGRMVSRSQSARIKHPINAWKAADFEECKAFVADKLGMTKEQIEERFRLHHESMPGRRPIKAYYPDGKGGNERETQRK